MLFVSLDECGNFESEPGNIKGNFVAGVCFFCDSMNDVKKEKKRIDDFLSDVCTNTVVNGNSCVFPADIHRRNIVGGIAANEAEVEAVKENLSNKMHDFLTGTGDFENNKPHGKYRLYGLAGKKGMSRFIKGDLSNLIDDGVAGNRYEHMAYRTIEDLLFYNPYIDESEIALDIATRQLVASNTSTEGMKLTQEAKKLGFTDAGDQHYLLTVQNSYKVALAQAIENSERDNIQFNVKVRSIDYHTTSTETYAFLYLADTICSILDTCRRKSIKNVGPMLERMNNKAIELTDEDINYCFAYDDIDDKYRKAYKHAKMGDYFMALYSTYINDFTDSTLIDIYKELWFSQIDKIICENNSNPNQYQWLQNAIENVKNYLHTEDYSVDIAKHIFTGLESVLKQFADNKRYAKLLFNMYLVEMTIHNHTGDYNKALESYDKAMKYSLYVDIEDYLGLRDMKSVALNDLGNYKESVEFTKETLQYKAKVKDMKMQLYPGNNEVFVHYGRGVSQLAQCYALNKQYKEAKECFEQAIELFGNSMSDIQRTRSYYLHMLIESGDVNTYEQVAEKYFETKDIKQQLDNIVNLEQTTDRFALYLYFKSLCLLYRDRIDSDIAIKVREIIESNKTCKNLDHPWSLIYKYMAIVIYTADGNTKSSKYIIKHSCKIVENSSQLLIDMAEEGRLQYERAVKNEPIFSDSDRFTFMYR